MAQSGEVVRVEGLNQLRKALRDIDPGLTKELRTTLLHIGQRIADRARAGIPRRSGRAAESYVARVSGSRAFIAFGGAKAPYAPWLDFGGRLRATGGRRNEQVRPYVQNGRYLYPAIDALAPQTATDALAAFQQVARTAGLL